MGFERSFPLEILHENQITENHFLIHKTYESLGLRAKGSMAGGAGDILGYQKKKERKKKEE